MIMPRRKTDFRGLAEANRVRLLGAIQSNPDCTLKELASLTGMPINTARDHARVLEQEGFVTAVASPTGTRGRPPVRYRAVDDPRLNSVAERRVARARRNRENRLQAVPASGRRALPEAEAHQIDTLYEHLDDTGVQPEVDERTLTIEVAPCPFLPQFLADPELVTSVHAQIVRDTLAQVPGPLRLRELRPFATPDSCQVQLERLFPSPESVGREPPCLDLRK